MTFGGNEYPAGFGIHDSRLYMPGAGQAHGDWIAKAKMRQHRWYPTASLTADGRVLVTSGSKYRHLWMFGGRRDGNAPATPTGDSLQRFGPVLDASQWDAPVRPLADNEERPAVREGHSVAYFSFSGVVEQVYFGGKALRGESGVKASRSIPSAPEPRWEFALLQNRPNPFSRATTFEFVLPHPAPTRLDVFDMQGRRVRTVVNRMLGAGVHQVEWDRRTKLGELARPGVYFYRLSAGLHVAQMRMVVLP
jgi:hypothetical protein